MATVTKTRPAPAEKPKRDERGRLLPGYTANPHGRMPGSRNRLSEAFIAALCADFEEHGAEAIAEMRLTDPSGYVKVVAALQPKGVQAEVKDDIDHMSLDELRDTVVNDLVALADIDETMLQMLGERLERMGYEETD